MKKQSELFIIPVFMVIMIGSLLSGSVWAKEIKTGSRSKLDGASIQTVTELSLQESIDGSSWTAVYGNLTSGYTMALDPANTYEYLDVETLTGTVADGDYGFILDEQDVPDYFYSYWAGKGVVSGATGWQGLMWQIINGQQPMYYLRVAGTEYDLIDGLSYLLYGSTTTERLKVNGDYPLGHYTFEGTVDGQYMIVGITFTRQATVSIVGETFTIDGCGFIDLYIHLDNVHDLYALDVTVEFEETMVEVMDLDLAAGVNLEPVSGLFEAAYWVINEANNGTGVIRYATTQYRPSEPATGSGNIAKIRLRAKALGTSSISITEMTLSDRDGYLVGLPLAAPITYQVTTQFTAAGGLDLGITRMDAATVQLNWPAQAVETVETFTLHRSTLPYFTPEETTVYQTITNNGTVATYDDEVLGNVDDNYFYTLQLTCDSGFKSPYAWQVGKFEYMLYETNTTDFSWVGFVLENDSILDSQDLADHVEDNIFTGQVSVKTLTRWNASGQSTTTYNHTTGTSIFDVFVKYPYRVEIDITNPVTTNSTVIWAQVGRLPQITENTYTLYETNTTDFTWVLHPLDLVSVTNTLQLADHIRANASASVNVLAIGRWNGTGQSFTSILTPVGGTSSFETRFGYPYRIESDIQSGTTVTWP